MEIINSQPSMCQFMEETSSGYIQTCAYMHQFMSALIKLDYITGS